MDVRHVSSTDKTCPVCGCYAVGLVCLIPVGEWGACDTTLAPFHVACLDLIIKKSTRFPEWVIMQTFVPVGGNDDIDD